ncbi:S8 family serine peptidase [Bacillus sp. EB106-08-02-XG196]|uniref:S8 family serine peptidase n=1 Tax=Bacillus sp. EB106-08-02-XG196 TaxID=2737049 RepID=UPI0015C47B44|nr:S8 family serine peptidase [Bacillus sp. EB106-08-02-XG196]NWQ43506.1 S8 family serine peptidase [Bacillus sp. EB106-08-02-XG196]
MSNRIRRKNRLLSISVLIAMLLNFALPQSLTLVHAAGNSSQQSPSSETFSAKEVNRILDGLTPEQKANINKLTGADHAQKIRVDQKDLKSQKNINVIVQFKQDPAKIQIIKQSLVKGGATVNSQAFASSYSDAQKKVKDSHTKFKSFLNEQPKTQLIGGKSVKTGISITREYSDAFNGVALTLPAKMVEKIAENPEVASIWSQVEYTVAEGSTSKASVTSASIGKPTTGLSLLGLDKLQAEGHTGIIKSGPRAGQKVKVGVLDTGIDYNHPDLKTVYKGGHDLVSNVGFDANGNIKYVDDLDPMETTYDDWVNAKANPDAYGPPPADYKQYITSHGSHVSGTIAANTTNNNDVYSANGVAPDVDLYGYRVLGPGGRGTSDSVLNGIDQAVKDDMDVINLSLGATINDPLYPTSIAINNATLTGVVCNVAAGNAGPGAATVGSPGTSALAITVGASTIPGDIPVMTLKNGSDSYQARLFGKNFVQADDAFKGQTFPIVDVGLGSAADYDGLDLSGKIALVKRGGEYLSTKMANAHKAGVAGMIIWNNNAEADNQGYITNGLGVSMDNVYSVSLTQAQGQALSDAIYKDPKSATITFPDLLDAPLTKKGDELANFSSTGPVKDWSIKPDVVAPGVDISSTVPYDVWEPQAGVSVENRDYKYAYELMSGTSMATPHVAGISALILAANPEYTPADVKSALMNTAKDINTDSKTYSVYQVGAGRVDPERAIKEDVKIQIIEKTYAVDSDANTLREVDSLTGSMYFGFKGRGEGATNGSDDVISTKDFNVTNEGTSSKTFKVSTQFISSKFAGSNKVGPGTGNDVKIDFSTGGTNVTSINVEGGSTVKATAKITVPSNSLEGIYEGYINLENTADSSESYRIPFTIIVAEKGIDTFKVGIKAMQMPNGVSAYNFSVNNTMESMYIVLKDKDGKYLGVSNTLVNASSINPGVQYGPNLMLLWGLYLPFTKPYEGSYDQSGISNKPEYIKEGSYSVEMIMTDASGKSYTAEDTLYVDSTPPTISMDSDSKPGIYEIDPSGYQSGQEIKGFYGTVYDSNVDVMKNNGETSVPSPKDGRTPVPVDQALNSVIGYQDSMFPTVFFDTNEKGRFHFGVTPEDLSSKFGSYFWLYPADYSGLGDPDTTKQEYYFIKKGNPYVTITNSGGVDAGQGNEDKVVVDANKPFKTTIATKYGVGMTGAKITLNSNNVYTFSNIRLTDEYKNYLISKGIDPSTVLTVSEPYKHDTWKIGENTDITISGIGTNGALDHDMNILEADVTYTSIDPVVGPFEFMFLQAPTLTLSGNDTKVAWFPTNVPYVRQSSSMLRGRVAAEAFARNTINNQYPQFTVDSGAKVTVKDGKGKSFSTDNPTTPNNTMAYQFINPYYSVTMDVSDSPYSVEASVPGHFKGYAQTPVIGENKFGYQSGTIKDLPGLFPILSAGDVNGDNVIDMKDLKDEINIYYQYKNLSNFNNPANTVANKTAFLNTNRNADIYWIKPTAFGYGIDYNDFYFIIKNFGKQNQSAIDAGIEVPTAQLTVDQDMTITTQYGGSITLNTGDTLQQVMQKLNFAGPKQKTSSTTIPKLQDLQNGASITLIPNSDVFVDDVIWRKAITNVLIGSTDVTSAVNIKDAYMYRDINGQTLTMPSQIILPGSLFPAAGNFTATVKATGYQDVTTSFTVSAVPIPTPEIPLVNDPEKAHVGKDLTFTFTDDANWRQGINNIKVKTANSTVLDITDLKDGSGNKYYDISVPGQITFKADLFKTNASPGGPTSAINPGGTNWLPQLYKFDISSTGTDGTIYPVKTIGIDSNGSTQQAVGYGITFDSQGGAPVNPIAVGYRADRTKIGVDFIYNNIGNFVNPSTTRPGYKFIGWFNEPEGTSQWIPSDTVNTDKTVYAKWQMSYSQNYSPVDITKPNGIKFDGTSGTSGIGWVLGEGDLNINIPDYAANIPWLTGKDKIAKIDATYYKLKSDGTTEATPTAYTLDPSTYEMSTNDRIGTLSFTTATESYATAHPNEKFAFSAAPSLTKGSPYRGYKLTVTATTGETMEIPDVKLGYRRHIDLNGGTLKNSNNLYFADTLVNGKATAPNMQTALSYVTNGTLSLSEKLYLDSANSSNMVSDISQNNGIFLTDNATYYLCWIKTPPTVLKDIVGNIVGSEITLNFTDDGTWKNNIKQVKIGSKELVSDKDYTITNSSITLNHDLFTAGQKVNVVIVSEGYADAVVTDQVVGYKVTFESNGGDPVPAQIVDRSATKPIDPTKVGFKFYGWYTDQNLTTPYDFASIVTKPITLYAKYALVGSLVLTDTTDNALGNDITLEFIEAEWANAISRIKVGAVTLDGSKYKVDKAARTITLDKSVFTKVGEFSINISATDYADVIVIQKVVNGYNVHFVLPSDAPDEVKNGVKDQIVARRITAPTVYGYNLAWFADEACTIPWDFTSSIYSAKTLYGKWSLHKFTVMFDKQDGGLVDSKTGEFSKTITAPTAPTRPGYAFLGWYKDPAGKTAWNFDTDKVEEDTILYAKWVAGVENNGHYNKDVIITFNEATAKLDGKGFTSGTKVTNEGNHTLVVTDASGNETIVKFTIDKTPPVVTGVRNNELYNKDLIITFNEGTAKLDGNDFTSGTKVTSEGSHTLEVTDAAANVTTLNFTIDKTAPIAPTVDTVTSKTKEVTGTAEANSTIVIKEGKDTIGIGKTDQDGKFTISIEKQKKGTNLYVTAKDKAGNVSTATKVTVSK